MNKNSPAGMSIHSNSTDWNTPVKYAEVIHKMFNPLELDPCSNAGSIIKAKTRFLLPQDGLKETWNYKTVFVNPPYGRDIESKTSIYNWFEKSYHSYLEYGAEILMLVPVATNTKHWKDYVFGKAAICFLKDTRLKFRINGSENNKGCPTACAMIYYGNNYARFVKIFSDYGYICK